MISSTRQPTVSIAIPTFNEEQHIEDIIGKFQCSDYPAIIEILVADGMSTDQTRSIVQKMAREDPRIRLVDNPERVQSAGLNKLISLARGELFLRADAHCEYSDDYVQKSVETVEKTGALNAGGPQRFVAANKFQAYVALAVDNIFGSGGAKYRDKVYAGFADTVFLGCYQTEVLKELGGFLTNNVTNEDAELNIRLQKEQDNAVYINPEIKVWYYPRKDFKSLFKQYFRYGKGRSLTVFRHSTSRSGRGITPFLAILLLIILCAVLLLTGNGYYVLHLMGGLLLLLALTVAGTVLKTGKTFEREIWRGSREDKPGPFARFFGVLTVVVTMNLAHFAGFGWQLVKVLFTGRKTW
jgi:succinoglycan biosynthesis protein ExoA